MMGFENNWYDKIEFCGIFFLDKSYPSVLPWLTRNTFFFIGRIKEQFVHKFTQSKKKKLQPSFYLEEDKIPYHFIYITFLETKIRRVNLPSTPSCLLKYCICSLSLLDFHSWHKATLSLKKIWKQSHILKRIMINQEILHKRIEPITEGQIGFSALFF